MRFSLLLLLLATLGCSDSRSPSGDGGRDVAMPFDTAPSTADPVQFCADRKAFTCWRDDQRGELTPEQRVGCTEDMIVAQCSGAMWPATCCPPNQAGVDRCIDALANPDRLDEATVDLPECRSDSLCACAE
jgi:hypothetical protein